MSIALAIALLFAAPSAAAQDARCIDDQFEPSERSALAALAANNTDPPAPLQARMEEIVAGCAARLGWTPEQAGNVTGLALAGIIVRDAGDRLRGVGIDPAAVDLWLSRQDERIRTTPDILEADAERLVLDLAASGVPMASLEEHGHLIGTYVGARAMVARVEAGLPLD